VCDGWKKRPKKWEIIVKDPFWEDPYISREQQYKLRLRHKIISKWEYQRDFLDKK